MHSEVIVEPRKAHMIGIFTQKHSRNSQSYKNKNENKRKLKRKMSEIIFITLIIVALIIIRIIIRIIIVIRRIMIMTAMIIIMKVNKY